MRNVRGNIRSEEEEEKEEEDTIMEQHNHIGGTNI